MAVAFWIFFDFLLTFPQNSSSAKNSAILPIASKSMIHDTDRQFAWEKSQATVLCLRINIKANNLKKKP